MKRFGTSSLVAVLLGLSAAMVLSFFVQSPANGQGQPLLTRHMREAVSSGQTAWVGRLPAAQSLKLTIALPLRNESQLDQVLQQLYDPRGPFYHQFLSVKEFTERFGPSQEDYDAVTSFAQSNGLTVTGTAPNRTIVDVTGPVANIEAAFHVNMGVYRHPTENRTFYAPDREPTADLPVALWHITGLDNFSIPRPAGLRRAPEAKRDATGTGSGPGGSFYGSDMRAAYYGGTTLTGSGQSVGLFEFSSYNASDVQTYFSNVKQTLNVPVNGVSTDGSGLSCTATSCGDAEPEVALDIEEAISMAPGLSQVLVYVAESSDPDIFNRMALDNIAKSLSCSWYWYPADPTSDDPYFKEFASQGQTLFVASGDYGSFPSNANPYYYPAEDAYVTSVGGTDLTTNGAGGAWESETAWSDSGGGISPDKIAIPTWQQTTGVITTANKGSKTYRNIPDVAAEANYDNYICYSGNGGDEGSGQHCDSDWGGTSFAAPRWAGYMALVNQQSVTNTGSTVGFINPAIYTIGLGSSYGADFHDIISGSNGTYSAETGYDLVTGWGSPNGTGLINSLQQSGSLTVAISPAAAVSAGAKWNVDGGTTWYASGAVVPNLGVGPHTVAFNSITGWTTPSSQTATITNGATTSLTGTYTQGGSLTVTISPAAAVSAGAMWNVDGGTTWYASGAVVPNLSVGPHTVAFNTITGWTAPSSQTATITNGATTSLTGTYVQQTQSGSLTVTISPTGAVTEGAMWNVDGGSWQSNGAVVPNLSVGSHTVAFSGVQGWTTPLNQTVTITSGQTASAIGTYTPIFAAIFTASRTSGKAPLTVHFTNSSVGSITKWLWNFGDGTTSKILNPTHTYSRARAYTVTLTVTGAGGTNTCTQPGYITVYAAPKAHFSAVPRSGDAPLQVNFTNESSGIVTSWLWHFGDGTTSTDENPAHTYDSPRTYTAKLTVYGPGGTGSKTLSILVKK
ncbi:MAG: PKD domain-containing protein [Syntrophobacteraceae bacterium]